VKYLTTAALVVAGSGQVAVTLTEPGFNTALGLGIGTAFFLLAVVAATGRWWALAVVAAVSGLLTIAAFGQLTDRIESGETGEVIRVLGFQALTATAAVAGTVSALRGYRTSHRPQSEA
jgi:hypothetical protein